MKYKFIFTYLTVFNKALDSFNSYNKLKKLNLKSSQLK